LYGLGYPASNLMCDVLEMSFNTVGDIVVLLCGLFLSVLRDVQERMQYIPLRIDTERLS